MFKKLFSKAGLLCIFLAIALIIGTFFVFKSDLKAITVPFAHYFAGNSLFKGKIHMTDFPDGTFAGREVMKIGLGNAVSEIRIDSPGSPLVSNALTGVQEIGATTGYVEVDDAADVIRYSVQLPEAWLDLANAEDMVFEFYIDEQGAGQCIIDVVIYEFNNTTAILADTLSIADGATAGWVSLVTNPTGIGADADLDPADVLVFVITPDAAGDDFRLYGTRMTYRMGLETTGVGVDP